MIGSFLLWPDWPGFCQDAPVDLLPCGHVAVAGMSRMCRHLFGSEEGGEHVRLLTGRGLEFDLCCVDCDRAARDGSPPELLLACEGCVALFDGADWALVAWRGEPEILARPERFDTTVVDVPLPVAAADLAPVAAGSRPVWLLLTEDGQIGRFDAGSGEWDPLARATVPAEPDHKPWVGHRLRQRLHGDLLGDFAAIVNDYGHHGQVVDLRTGAVTLSLHGGDYHPETVPFSLAFIRHQGRAVVIHRTGWNRLDVSDAATGELLTSRGPTSYRRGEPRPEHYLDYFHGALHLSPGGRWIADDGWVWHPAGVPTVWDAHRWLRDYVWESEDGPSWRPLCQRGYLWDTPMCWTGENLLAISGIGDDDEAMLPGVRIFDVSTDAQVTAFAGPAGALFAAMGRLYSAAPDGLDVWDPLTGERTGTIPGFVPASHHPAAGELAGISGGILRRWTIPPMPVPQATAKRGASR
jgi:hypothetical protein